MPDVIPVLNSYFNATDVIMVAANVTDEVAVSRVFANISEPNGTIVQLELLFRSGNRYNNSFTAPAAVGVYTLTFFSNDSSSNENRTISSNLTLQIGCGSFSNGVDLTLERNISSAGTCFNFPASNITLDCAGYSVSYGSSGYGINVTQANNVTIKNCQIVESVAGTSSIGIYLRSVQNVTVQHNNITTIGNQSYGITIADSIGRITLLNNNISTNNTYGIYDNSTVNKTILYNNSNGQINWTLANLTTNISLRVGSTIFIESNKVGLTDDPQALTLDGAARVQLRGLTYTTPQLLKNGDRCDNSNACNITYSGGILYASISSFSNYTAQETPAVNEETGASGGGGGGSGCASGYSLVDGKCTLPEVKKEEPPTEKSTEEKKEELPGTEKEETTTRAEEELTKAALAGQALFVNIGQYVSEYSKYILIIIPGLLIVSTAGVWIVKRRKTKKERLKIELLQKANMIRERIISLKKQQEIKRKEQEKIRETQELEAKKYEFLIKKEELLKKKEELQDTFNKVEWRKYLPDSHIRSKGMNR
ncbi:right-handed parallel beta-helix repeat-containing protein [Candidatus Woesearchaeota archaeon]|nr:right-handed parallel beta-helix repeat-containing protein [Candidatus Woesearchaeota archaeon]